MTLPAPLADVRALIVSEQTATDKDWPNEVNLANFDCAMKYFVLLCSLKRLLNVDAEVCNAVVVLFVFRREGFHSRVREVRLKDGVVAASTLGFDKKPFVNE
jgi:hypothetical protein